MLNMRPKKKESSLVSSRLRDINQNTGDCANYKDRLEEYRRGLYELSRSDMTEDPDPTGNGEGRCVACDMNRENLCAVDNVKNHDCTKSREFGNHRDSQLIRNSMHWEEFFGSSLELAPSLLSIFDSIASASKNTDQREVDQSKQLETNTNSVSSSEVQDTPTIKIDAENCHHSNSMESCNDHDTNDNKKRPLSISSMSSSSSSSLPRHTSKKPNLTQYDSRNSLRMDNKLDSILFIDDDIPRGVTDEEMSIDTDGENHRKTESDTSSNRAQSSVSLSSNSDNVSKSPELVSQNQPSSDMNENDLDPKSQMSLNQSDLCASTKTPDSSFSQTPDKCSSSISSPAEKGQGQSPTSATPVRHSSVRDSTSPQKYVSRVQRVVAEIVETEKTYVCHLKEIIEGYMNFLQCSDQPSITEVEAACLFGNIQEIYDFSSLFSKELDDCEDDPVKVAQCFVRNNEGFAIYTDYCTNYPSAVEVLTTIMSDPVLSEKFKQQQLSLGHNLPLGAYLLKPVQRVLKYHLLLHNILKNFDKSDSGHAIVSQALDHMTGRAQHINEMKRKHEHAVRVQEIQSTLEDYEGEDLTRLGELVLESSFRTYGAKTSRHVFLFEKGVLIAKRKENAMLSCKIFIKCSNLMLVESLPKEPLSFQVIPFDNPKGQHILQARNVDQKRKWCQEIKRLILESFKGKIPEKVKGLVMQLGKSKSEDSPDTKKFHHLAPDYLEKRQRTRRKSGGTLLTDILKHQRARKAQKRAESVSPRTSPTLTRKFKSPLAAENSAQESQKLNEGDESSIGGADDLMSHNSTESDQSSIMSLTSQNDLRISTKANVGRSTSFRTAIRSRPLHSYDYDDQLPPSPVEKSPAPTPSRRSKSFRIATRLKPLLSRELTDQQTTSLPSSPSLSCAKLEFAESLESNNPDHEVFEESDNKQQHCGLSRFGKFNSMPVLIDKENLNATKRRSNVSLNLSGSGFNFGNVKQSPKRVIDARQYFSRNKENTPSLSSLNDTEEKQNLRMEGKTVSAFNDSFLKKSTENLSKSPINSKKVITLTKPLSLTNVLNKAYDRDDGKYTPSAIFDEDPWVYNYCSSSKENKTTQNGDLHSRVNNRHQRTRSFGGELDDFTPDNINWIVYANRNSLPVTGISTDDLPKLYKSNSPVRNSSYPSCHRNLSLKRSPLSQEPSRLSSASHYISPEIDVDTDSSREGVSEVARDRDNLPYGSGDHDVDPSALGSLPMINKPVDNCLIQTRKQVKVSRSNSTPCSRPEKYLAFNRHHRTQSVDVDFLDDPEKLLAEMEDYMKRSDSTLTLSSQRFPTQFAMSPEEVKEVPEEETNRDSYVSTISSSSYESHESSDNQEGLVETFKNKIQDIRKKIYRRSGSYDNKYQSGSDLDNDSDAEQLKTKNTESKTSLWSLNTWFSPKKESPPDLSTVLHAGDLGGTGIGSRMADPDPIYEELSEILPRFPKAKPSNEQPACDENKTVSTCLKVELQKSCDNSQDASVQNLNIQQCDSAFSIDLGDSSSASEESPRAVSDKMGDKPPVPNLKKADSFYEKRLSIAFDESEVFRDSAVYCDMDLDHQPLSPCTSTPAEVKPQRLPIKAYVQKLEEQSQHRQPQTTKVRQREPGEIIKQRLESLQNSSTRRSQSCSRHGSEERDFSRHSSCSSRSISVDREVAPLRFSLVNMDSTLESSIVKPKADQFKPFDRENSEPGFRGRSRSRSKSPGGTLRPASSLGRLDQLSSDVENLVIMRGWVRQLIDKFQPTNQ